jgi:PAS domain S-box-containing protein
MEVMNETDQLLELRRKMVEQVQDYAIILLDINGKILSWNKGVERIKGYKEEEIIGQNFSIFYLPLDRQHKLPENLIALAKKEGSAKHIGRRVKKDGTIYWGSIVITALHDEQNNVIGFTKLTRELRNGDTE